jgi:predicted ferric reductase
MTSLIKRVYFSIFVIFTFAWALSARFIPEVMGFFEFRFLWVQFSGALTLVLASIGVLLATRAKWLDGVFSGLDKMYRLHRWIGLSVLSIACCHFLLAKGTKWAVAWGWLPRPMFGAPPEREIGTMEQLFRDFRGEAVAVGEWSFYLLCISVAVAVLPFISYQFFRRFHRLMPLLYMALIVHGVTVFNFQWWGTPVGLLLILTLVVGAVSAIYCCWRWFNHSVEHQAKIRQIRVNDETQTCHLQLVLDQPWQGHKAGQFVFFRHDKCHYSHPFTLTCCHKPLGRTLNLSIRAVGNFTSGLPYQLANGDNVCIDGPFGGFTFSDKPKEQIWIAGGIGITPFLARLDELSKIPHLSPGEITLFYTAKAADPIILSGIHERADIAGIKLHLFIGAGHERLSLESIQSYCPHWLRTSIWFCGPQAFAKGIGKELKKQGFPQQHFHQELYQFR